MLKSKQYILVILFIWAQPIFAEKTAGFCSLSEEEQGKEVLALFPGTEFLCLPANTIKNRVWINAWVPSYQLYDGLRLQEKTKIYNQQNKAIGKVNVSFNPMQILEVNEVYYDEGNVIISRSFNLIFEEDENDVNPEEEDEEFDS